MVKLVHHTEKGSGSTTAPVQLDTLNLEGDSATKPSMRAVRSGQLPGLEDTYLDAMLGTSQHRTPPVFGDKMT